MITVVIPTYNPKPEFINRTLDALKEQSLPREKWELMIIDNASPTPLSDELVSWHPKGRIVREDQLGLTHARLCAIRETTTELMLWVDDDNLLVPGYLQAALDIFSAHPKLGCAGGPSIPEYQIELPEWFEPGIAPIGCRDLGDNIMLAAWDENYPECAPIGAGMITRTEVIRKWAKMVTNDPARQALGRTGNKLTSGEDNDMNLFILRDGWSVGYFPLLKLTHLIPGGRLSLEYQKRINRVAYRDYVRVLAMNGIRPWPAIPRWSVWPRALRAWFTHRAWKSKSASITWHGIIGQYEGRASL